MGELRRLYYQTKEIKSFKTFKWLLKGRWNQGSGNSGNTRTYLEWDELGISYVGSGGVKYGPTYWTVDSYSSSGSLFSSRPASEMFDGEWGTEGSKSDYKNINDTDGYVEIIIHTTSGEAIVPNGVGLISCNNQSSYASSTPAHFILYGLNESTNEYVKLIDVPASSVNKGNTQTTTITFDPVKVVTGTYYLLSPSDISRGSGLRWEIHPMLTIDLNTQGTDCTSEFLSQTKYPGVWTGYRVFRLGDLYTQNTHYYNYIKNLSNLSSNFTMYYFFAMVYNDTYYSWGKATYSTDSSNCVAQTGGWTTGGQDSKNPQYDKSRYRSVTVDVSKGGNINWDFYYNREPWYGNSIYYAIPQELVQDVINSK